MARTHKHSSTPRSAHDVIVVGAGIGGLYALYELRRRGLDVVVLEAGEGVGGTWYWNRYPGARVDVYSLSYSYSFSPELDQEWEWKEYFAAQPELEAYLNHVADRFGLRSDILLGRRVTTARWDEGARRWTVADDTGERFTSRFVIWATGSYSRPKTPDIPGLDDFAGELYHTPTWPREPVSFADKRVGVVGTGATGMQVVTALSKEPLAHLTVFQRTPEYVVPAGALQVDPEHVDRIRRDYPAFREAARRAPGGVVYDHFERTDVGAMDDDEFEAFMRAASDHPLGFYPLSGIKDLLTDRRVNDRVAEFIRSEIRRRVTDPATADKLTPRGYHLGSRRIIGERGYLEIFNRSDVTLVDVRADPIERVTPHGVRTASDEHPLDMLILATGFDSGTGALSLIDIRGEAQTLAHEWREGYRAYLGIATSGFPNSFMVWGPGSPSIRSQGFIAVEQQVDWLADLLDAAREGAVTRIESTPEADAAWSEHTERMVRASLLGEDDAQYYGSNVPGKPRRYLAYSGGTYVYGRLLERVRDAGYEGFELTRADGTSATSSRAWSGPPRDGSLQFRLGNTAI
ncbi:MAG: NAD(P)/FAD-dependent oxidoreductase [Microbacterium sp.]